MRLPAAWLSRLQHPLVVTAEGGPHLRDPMSLERANAVIGIALLPVVAMAVFNTGLQANLILSGGGVSAPGWRGSVVAALGVTHDPASMWGNIVHGAVYFVPVLAIAWLIGFGWQRLFARLRRIDPDPGLAVTALIYALILPPTLPLWQVALGISFGLVLGREVFGGAGRTFLNPALVGAVFLVISYPAEMAGSSVWVAIDGYTGATPLAAAAQQGMAAISAGGVRWIDAFLGQIPGAFGETSTLACLIGAAVLLAAGLASWRIIAAIVLGAWAMTEVMAVLADGYSIAGMPPHWHLVVGGFAFGTVFIATDPASAAMTDAGRWFYGFLIGALTIVIRVANPGHAEGMMFALLLGSIAAPLIDYAVMRANIRRRARRHAAGG